MHESARTTSKILAREAERQRRRELAEKWNRIEKRSLPPTLAEAARRWLEKRAGLAPNTLETYEVSLGHVKATLGTMLVCEIEARHVAAYQKARQAKGAAGATVNEEIACLSSIIRDYSAWEQVRRDVKRLEENEEASRALRRDEERLLLERASIVGRRQGNWTPLYTVAVLGLNTGMRRKENRTLKGKNLDLENRVLKVGESKTEAGKGCGPYDSRIASPSTLSFPRARTDRLSPSGLLPTGAPLGVALCGQSNAPPVASFRIRGRPAATRSARPTFAALETHSTG